MPKFRRRHLVGIPEPSPRARIWTGFFTGVLRRYRDANGEQMASAICVALLYAVFPLALLTLSFTGLVSSMSESDVAQTIVEELGLTGDPAAWVHEIVTTAAQTRASTGIIGLLGLLWAGGKLGVALGAALDAPWGVTGSGIVDRVRATVWLVALAALVVAALARATLGDLLPAGLSILLDLAGILAIFAAWLGSAASLGRRDAAVRDLMPGAALGTAGLVVLRQAASWLIPYLSTRASAVYGGLAALFAAVTALLLFGRLVVLTSSVNAETWFRRHPTARPGERR